jgi:hypothetical protein
MRLSLRNFDRNRVRMTTAVTFVGLLLPLLLSLVTGNPVVAQFPILQVYLSPILLIAAGIGLKTIKDEPTRSTWMGILIGTVIAAIVGTCIFFWMLWTLGWLG